MISSHAYLAPVKFELDQSQVNCTEGKEKEFAMSVIVVGIAH